MNSRTRVLVLATEADEFWVGSKVSGFRALRGTRCLALGCLGLLDFRMGYASGMDTL